MLSVANTVTRSSRKISCLPVRAGNTHLTSAVADDQCNVDRIIHFHWLMAGGGVVFPTTKAFGGNF